MRRAPRTLNPVARLGWYAWHTLTSVRFAVLQISVLAVAGVIGTVLQQLPAFALHDPQAYAEQMTLMHASYDPLSVLGLNVGPGMVDLFERLGFFRVFSAPWFIFLLTLLVVSITVCTLDRLPDLWRAARTVKVVQAEPFFDLRLDNRAAFTDAGDGAADDLVRVLRGQRYRIWARLEGDRLKLAMIADRYVDTEREFGRLLDDLAARLRNRPERRLQPFVGSGRT